jgi:hypothetical protein
MGAPNSELDFFAHARHTNARGITKKATFWEALTDNHRIDLLQTTGHKNFSMGLI